jgi:predicted nucleic acid-binding Zn ribbon protein
VSTEDRTVDGDREPTGPELAQAVLDAARAKRAERPARARSSSAGARRPRGYSGAGPDPRDPQPFGVLLANLVKSRGWQRPAAEGRIFGAWEAMVGADLASHSRPVKLVDGELTIEAESTAWATQVRLLSRTLVKRIAAEVGRDVVTRIQVHGPVAPSWAKGPKRVRGRGPRDTYG